MAREEVIYAAVPERTQLDQLVEKAECEEDILKAWAEHRGNANEAAKTIVRLVRLAQRKNGGTELDLSQLTADSRLQDMMNTIGRKVVSVWNWTLVSLLSSLSAFRLPPGTAMVSSVQNEVLWRVRRLSYKQLAYLVDWGVGRQGEQEAQIVGEAVKQLELRWTEISDPRTVSTLMARAGHLPPTFLDRLEDKLLELVDRCSAEYIRRMCLSLASQGRRSVPVLRALSYHVLQKPSSDLNTPLLLDIVYAYGKLNFHHSQVLQRIASELLPRIPEFSPNDLTRCAKSLAFLKWLNLPLFQAFTEHYTRNSQKYSSYQHCNLIMSLAKLGFQPNKGEEFYKEVHAALEPCFPTLEPVLQTDVLWSLCVLQQAKPEYFTCLINNKHLAKLSEGSPSRVDNYYLKFLHIAATLQLEHPESTLSFPSPFAPRPDPGRDLSPLQRSLRETLEGLVGQRAAALRTGVHTVYGWTIEGEMVVDSENQPMDLVGLTAPHLPLAAGDKPLPHGAQRLAFLAWEFPHYVSKGRDLLGRFSMMKRHLQLAGFILVQVPYYEWLPLKSDWQRVGYLKDKMRKAVAEDMAK